MKTKSDPRIDHYIAEAAPFARPVLRRLRQLVHQGCPAVEEALKWNSPFFLYRGKILCFMAAFKAHAAFGFWGPAMKKLIAADGVKQDGMGVLGRITSLDDLPSDRVLLGYIRQAQSLHDAGTAGRPKPKKAPASLPVPADLSAALKQNQLAAATWTKLAPSHRREYITWITEAKREETREKRLRTTLEWLADGKARNWKYEKC